MSVLANTENPNSQNTEPYQVDEPQFSNRTLAAMEEAKRISRDPNVPSYKTMEDLIQALEAD